MHVPLDPSVKAATATLGAWPFELPSSRLVVISRGLGRAMLEVIQGSFRALMNQDTSSAGRA